MKQDHESRDDCDQRTRNQCEIYDPETVFHVIRIEILDLKYKVMDRIRQHEYAKKCRDRIQDPRHPAGLPLIIDTDPKCDIQ